LYTLFCSTGTVKGTSRGWGSQKFFKNWASSDVLQRQIKESEPYKYRELMANLGTILAHTSIAGMHYCSAAVC